MSQSLQFFASAPKGIEGLLAEELAAMGAAEVKETRAGVHFAGSLEIGYRACLWSRLASRIFLSLATFPVTSPDELYQGTLNVPWQEHLNADGSLAVSCTLRGSSLTHSHFAALKVKDAIVDQLRDNTGIRPQVDLETPDLRVHVHLEKEQGILYLDLSGEALHRRAYRCDGVAAPLKENLAAAVLLRAGWPEVAASGGPLFDPMCGSGTLPLEAALMAADIAPGLLRSGFGFSSWLGHDVEIWERLCREAEERRENGLETLPSIVGFDADASAITAAWNNARRAGLEGKVHFERCPLEKLTSPFREGVAPGLVVVNPPYGARLGEEKELVPLYRQLGAKLRENFPGWRASVLTGNPDLGKVMGIRAQRFHALFNGAIPCRLLHFILEPEWFVDSSRPARDPQKPLSEGMQMLGNRLKKNRRTLGRWAKQEGIHCYRLYDADLPEYAFSIDLYEDWAHVQEYAPPASIDPNKAEARRREVMATLSELLDLPHDQVFFKMRQRQKGTAQYHKFAEAGEFYEVREDDCRFLVNFSDYLDTGLFLDHRLTRQMIRELAVGKSFLNLFAYTGTATVYAAKGGAASTTTVDMSKTYLDWAGRNLALNGFQGKSHRLFQEDCMAWLRRQRDRYDLIFLDPPTFSNSARMQDSFDVQRDQVTLIEQACALLERNGVLLFSNNFRKFKLSDEIIRRFEVEDISAATIPKDFQRNPKIHRCWKITRR